MSEDVSQDVVELEIDEERIVGYLVDEDDNEIGIIYKDDEGKEIEIYFDEITEAETSEQVESADEDVEEMEIDSDAIAYYLVTPAGDEIGFVAINESGEKEEYLYPQDAVERFYLITELEEKLRRASGVKGAAGSLVNAGKDTVGGVVNSIAGKEVVKTSGESHAIKSDDDDDGVDRDDLKDMFNTFKDVAIEGYAALSGVMDQVDDVRDSLDEINPKKRRQNRRAKKAAEAAAQPMVVQQVVSQPPVEAAPAAAAATVVAAAEPASAPAAPASAAPAASDAGSDPE